MADAHGFINDSLKIRGLESGLNRDPIRTLELATDLIDKAFPLYRIAEKEIDARGGGHCRELTVCNTKASRLAMGSCLVMLPFCPSSPILDISASPSKAFSIASPKLKSVKVSNVT